MVPETQFPLLSADSLNGKKCLKKNLPKHAFLGKAQFAAFGEILKKIKSSTYISYSCFRFNKSFLLTAQDKQLDYLT